jgi:hypothetical protein
MYGDESIGPRIKANEREFESSVLEFVGRLRSADAQVFEAEGFHARAVEQIFCVH